MPHRHRLTIPTLFFAAGALACAHFGPPPTLPPPLASATASASPGPETPTPRPESLTQPAARVTPATAATAGVTTPLPPIEGEVFAHVIDIADEVPGVVREMHFTPDGTLWLLTDTAVARLVGDAWDVVVTSYDGDLVGVDELLRVWVAAPDGSGIQAWDGAEWRDFGVGWQAVSQGAGERAVQPGLAGDQLGRIWLATAQDVRAFDGEQWEIFDRAAMGFAQPAGDDFTLFTVDVARRDGVVWVAACDIAGSDPTGAGGLRWFDGNTWQGSGSAADTGCARAITASAQGPVWVGLDAAVLGYDSETDTWTTYTAPAPPTGERFGYVSSIALDPFERPWPLMATCDAASCDAGQVPYRVAEDGAWVQIAEPSAGRLLLKFDIAGSGWLFGEDGAQRVTADQIQPAGDMRVMASAVDEFGQIWVAGEQQGDLALWTVRPGNE